jgi:hypothetical protein
MTYIFSDLIDDKKEKHIAVELESDAVPTGSEFPEGNEASKILPSLLRRNALCHPSSTNWYVFMTASHVS